MATLCFQAPCPWRPPQVRAHHYCSHVNEEVRQFVLYDGPGADAKLIGIEYIISRRLYEGLPPEEKPFWHSHVYEVTSGMLYCPNVSGRQGGAPVIYLEGGGGPVRL
jgi:hypothetical protein